MEKEIEGVDIVGRKERVKRVGGDASGAACGCTYVSAVGVGRMERIERVDRVGEVRVGCNACAVS